MVRQARNVKLQSSDRTEKMFAINRLVVEQFNAWQQHRQALRDVPLQGNPYKVVWPQAPSH
jgi:hypothetical protein